MSLFHVKISFQRRSRSETIDRRFRNSPPDSIHQQISSPGKAHTEFNRAMRHERYPAAAHRDVSLIHSRSLAFQLASMQSRPVKFERLYTLPEYLFYNNLHTFISTLHVPGSPYRWYSPSEICVPACDKEPRPRHRQRSRSSLKGDSGRTKWIKWLWLFSTYSSPSIRFGIDLTGQNIDYTIEYHPYKISSRFRMVHQECEANNNHS